MAARISTVMGEAVISGGVWTSKNKDLENYLNAMRPTDHTGAVPSYNNWVAEKALELLPYSQLVECDEIDYEGDDEEEIY